MLIRAGIYFIIAIIAVALFVHWAMKTWKAADAEDKQKAVQNKVSSFKDEEAMAKVVKGVDVAKVEGNRKRVKKVIDL